MNRERLERVLQDALNESSLRVRGMNPLMGGCISNANRVETTHGDFFLKWNASAPSDFFQCEARGLQALAVAEPHVAIPKVVAASIGTSEGPGFIVLEFLRPSSAVDEERFGRGLAALHRATSATFGFDVRSYCGATPQDNTREASWVSFYRDRRLRPLISTLEATRDLDRGGRAQYEGLFDKLDALLPKRAMPSLIHGDLWSGNVLATDRGPALIDPACAYADREMEFGITTLFGGLSARGFAAYEEAWPMEPGWRERNPLYQLYHLLNHAVLFGGSYESEARGIATRFAG